MSVMGSYLPLFSIEVEHSFFSEGLCLYLDPVPTPRTDVVIKNAGLLIRNTLNGVRVFRDEKRSESLQLYAADPDEPLSLGFKVFSRDPFFENYTEPPAHQEDSILYFGNRGVEIDTTGKFRLHDGEYVSETDFEKLNSPLLEGTLSKKDRLLRPMFIVQIGVSEEDVSLFDDQSKATAKNYYIKFKARQTFWKYYLLGDIARQDSYIADLNKETEFDFAGRESLSDNRVALTFRSQTPIPLQEKSDCRFQLRERNSGGGKVLINRLPVASANQISKEVIEGEEAFVSEVFVNC
jgi:hypothetical protein